MPWIWLRALTVAAISWSWERLALALSVAFFGLLRPTEIPGLRRVDCVLPQEHKMGEFVLLRIAEPKSRWAAGKQQYARIDGPDVLLWLVQQLGWLMFM